MTREVEDGRTSPLFLFQRRGRKVMKRRKGGGQEGKVLSFPPLSKGEKSSSSNAQLFFFFPPPPPIHSNNQGVKIAPRDDDPQSASFFLSPHQLPPAWTNCFDGKGVFWRPSLFFCGALQHIPALLFLWLKKNGNLNKDSNQDLGPFAANRLDLIQAPRFFFFFFFTVYRL